MIQDGPTPLQCQQHLLRFDVCELEKKTHIASGVSCSTRISGSAMTSGLPTNQCSNGCFGSEGLSLRPRLRNGFGRTDLGMHQIRHGQTERSGGRQSYRGGECVTFSYQTGNKTLHFPIHTSGFACKHHSSNFQASMNVPFSLKPQHMKGHTSTAS